jgi:hypothetical protein
LFQETLSNQPTFFGNSNSNNDFLANTTDDYSNNNSSNHGFLNSRNHMTPTNMDGQLNISNTEMNLPILGVGGGANTTITSGGIPSTHPHQILGSTPLSQIGCPPLNLEQYSAQLSPSCGDSEDEIDSELESNADDLGSNYSLHSGSKRQKRGILPKHATSVMRAWLFQHLVVCFSF